MGALNQSRLAGIDVARALAIIGMVMVNFKNIMHAYSGNKFLLLLSSTLETKASALFVILAGISISLLTKHARKAANRQHILKYRALIIKRGLLLAVIGFALKTVWKIDILHFYGFYFVIASSLLMVNHKTLLFIASIFIFCFPILMWLFTYDENLYQQSLWPIEVMIREVSFSGLHAIFPWFAFFAYGMWLGRLELSNDHIKRNLFLWSIIVWVITQSTFHLIQHSLFNIHSFGMSHETIEHLFSVSFIPPLPQYMISAASAATVVLATSLFFAEKFSKNKLTTALSKMGRLSLTLYITHAIIGLCLAKYVNQAYGFTITTSLLYAFLFCMLGILFSIFWLKYFRYGPLEWIFRKVAS